MKGRFITIEGVEGVGKSTNISYIERFLEARDIEFVSTREPGGTALAERIRDVLLDKAESSMDPMTELLLMFAARKQHTEELIKPALKRGEWVICDRYTDSSYAYQGGGRGLDSKIISKVEKLTLGSFKPDLTIVLDLPVKKGLARAGNRGELDRFELESEKFFKRVRATFLARAKTHKRYHVINASRSLSAVQGKIGAALTSLPALRSTR
ncbi:dTMP kinase [Pseudomonadales bacterium]|jgi:dTMP kinase|nr:dTMP kinase [Gammaproteobacteria bacterium]MDA7725468.1 dTMP kinase [Pseudomonadales bacterium]MDA8879836.1 dTMP kinase [Pseudomonadales bacterium]MDC1479017.1 dTMP kinase [Pseudomonadales bacterium]|tara:strand:+ start:774 stop:1406 length:633 start_codon:yes stop_codon:yes gene_type:complete